MLLFFVRHGDPIYEPDSLTALGKRQAEAVAKRLAVYGMDEIYASTSNRAYETAVPLSELTKREITQIDFFNEGKYAWKYFTIQDENGKKRWIYNNPKFKCLFSKNEIRQMGDQWYEHYEFANTKLKDGIEFFASNVDEFMASLGYEHNRKNHTYKATKQNDKRIAVFAHEGAGCAFLSSVLDIPYPIFASHFAMSHSGVTVIEFDECGDEIVPRLLQHSNDSHLYKEGLPTYYGNVIPI